MFIARFLHQMYACPVHVLNSVCQVDVLTITLSHYNVSVGGLLFVQPWYLPVYSKGGPEKVKCFNNHCQNIMTIT